MDYNKTIVVDIDNNKGWIAGLTLVVFAALIFVLYQIRNGQQSGSVSSLSDTPAYQTGKAFEVIEPERSTPSFSNKSPEELISEADQITARADAIIGKHNLGDLEITAEQKQALEQRAADITRKIDELERQLIQ